jgi:hypothetical protein
MALAGLDDGVCRVVDELAPVGPELPEPDGEDEQRETGQAEEPLHLLERHPPDDDPDEKRDERDEQQVGHARRELQRERDAGHLRGQGEQVDQRGSDEVDQRDAGPHPLANEVEDGASAHRRDAAGHVGVHDDPEDTHQHDPRE